MSRRFVIEMSLYAVVVASTVVILRMIDAFDRLYALSRAHEAWELDELFAAVPGILAVMLYFSIRRSLELRKEVAARKEAEARLRTELQMKTDFMALVSHEMRTPLNGVIGMLDGMKYFHAEQDREMMRDHASKTAHSLARQLDDIITFARIEQGQMHIEEEPFEPEFIVEDVVEIMSFKAMAQDVEISKDIDPALPKKVLGHRGYLNQVLLNLADNAVKFTEKGTVRISTAFEGDDSADRGMLVFTVADSGKGIAPEHLDHIFEPYFQEQSYGPRRYPGLGIGLSLVHQLVPLMNGTIEVESEQGQGTTFVLRVPVEVPLQQ